jgi:A/G-specific adenine glycosylase
LDDLAARVVAHYRRHGRDLPWRRTRDPYAIWICEIMAQQTRLDVVERYWTRWMARFPTVAALAAARLDDVLALWAGLGYYSRARNLHRAAQLVVERHGGAIPDDPDAILALPGIGRYTAGAIASIAFGRRLPLLDGNVRRVLSRVTGEAAERRLWARAAELVPEDAPGDFNQGLMDLGATLCTPRDPRCLVCPLAGPCVARREGRVAELPPARRRPAVRTVEVDLAWIVRGGRVAMGRRAPDGLYGGLWELPEAGAVGAACGEALATHTQKLSHRTLIYRVRAAAIAGRLRAAAPYDRIRLVSPDSLGELAVSSATAALLAVLTKGIPWPTPNAPPSSSAKASTRSSPGSRSSVTTSRTRTSATRRRAPRGGWAR